MVRKYRITKPRTNTYKRTNIRYFGYIPKNIMVNMKIKTSSRELGLNLKNTILPMI